MAARRRSYTRRPPRQARTWIAILIVAALAVGVGILSVLALQRTEGDPDASTTAAPIPTFADSEPAPTATPSASATPTAPTVDAATQRFLTFGSGALWRAVAGACGGDAPVLETSDDDGATWSDVTPLYRDVREIVSVDSFAGTEAEVIAATGDGCEAGMWRTFTQGTFWDTYPDILAGARYPDPANPQSIVTPEGTVDAPCAEPTGFRAYGDVVALVCENTAFALSGTEWAPIPTDAVITLGLDADTLVVAHVTSECAGVALDRYATGDLSSPADTVCAADTDPTAPLAVAPDGEAVRVWSGDALSRIE